MKTAAIYVRVSSTLQDIENSIQAQVAACQEYANKENLEILEIYSDKAESGTSASRPEFQRMISDARQKKSFDVILVHKLDRFSRNREDAVTYKALLRKHKVELFSVTEKLQNDIYSRLVEGILEVIAEFYSLNLAEEVRKGKRQALARGFHPGGHAAFGYKLQKIPGETDSENHSKLIPDPKTAPIIQEIFSMVASGQYIQDVVNYLRENKIPPPFAKGEKKEWHVQTIYRILKNRLYLGEFQIGGVIRKNHHPALITPEIFNLAQNMKKENVGKKLTNSFYLLSGGIIICKNCGSKFSGHKMHRKQKDGSKKYYRYYICQGYQHQRICNSIRLDADLLEKRVYEIFLEEVGQYTVQQKQPRKDREQEKRDKIKTLEKELSEIARKKKNIIAAIANGLPVEEFREALRELSFMGEEKDQILKEEKKKVIAEKPLKKLQILELKKILPKFSPEKLKVIYKEMVKIEVDKISKSEKKITLKILLNPGYNTICREFLL